MRLRKIRSIKKHWSFNAEQFYTQVKFNLYETMIQFRQRNKGQG